jgi:hypothetical protein
MWMAAPHLSLIIIQGFYQYFLMPLEFIIGLALMQQVLNTMRTTLKKGQ